MLPLIINRRIVVTIVITNIIKLYFKLSLYHIITYATKFRNGEHKVKGNEDKPGSIDVNSD